MKSVSTARIKPAPGANQAGLTEYIFDGRESADAEHFQRTITTTYSTGLAGRDLDRKVTRDFLVGRSTALPRIVLIGASGHGQVVLESASREGKFEVMGFIDARLPLGEPLGQLGVLGREADLPALLRDGFASGYTVCIGDNAVRAAVIQRLTAACPSLELVSISHPSTILASNAKIDSGTVRLAGSVVGTNCRVGRGCLINTNASLDHDSSMGDYSSLAPGVATGGNVHIGRFTAIGIGATILHGVTIGDHAVIGAGAVVLHDVPSYTVAYGVPAREIRSREAGEPYL